jgi:hypothetical protein
MIPKKSAHLAFSGFCGLMLAAFLGQSPSILAQADNHVVVVKATRHAFAPPLSQVKPVPAQTVPARTGRLNSSEADNEMLPGHGLRAGGGVQDSAVQDSVLESSDTQNFSDDETALATTHPLAATAGINILGIGVGFPGYSTQNIVPDTTGAAGPTQFVQWVDDSFAVFNKVTGAVLYGPANGNTLWQSLGGPCANNNINPVVLYDQQAGSWVMTMPAYQTPGYLCVAVSTSSDAVNGGWNLYAFEVPTINVCGCRPMQDYPKWAVWPDGYYVSYNQGWDSNGNTLYEGAAACVVNRSAMLAGDAATMQCFQNTTGTAYGSMLPADMNGSTPPPSGSPEYYASFDYNDASLDVWQFHVNWTTPAASTFTGPTNIPVTPFVEPCGETVTEITYTTGDCVPQAGTTQEVDGYGDRLMFPLVYRNFGSYASLVANHAVDIGSSPQTGIRWYELRNPGSGFSLYQQGTYAPDSNYRWMGSVAMDKAGDIGVAYSVSSSSMSPSIRYTGRLSTDTLGTMEGESDVLSAAGITPGSETTTWHWGGYSSLAVDPTDDCTFWSTAQYIPTTGAHWATRISSFSFPACTSTVDYTLTVGEVGDGTVTSADGEINCINGSGNCSATYAGGTAVTLTASAANGWNFINWSGPCNGGNPCNLNVTSSVTATANFNTAWDVVNKASNTGSPLTTLAIPSTGTGNVIVIGLVFNGTTKVSTVTDNAGNLYVSAGAHSAKGNLSSDIWYALNSKPGATAVSVTFAGAPTHAEMTEWEVAGLANSAPDTTAITSGLVTSTTQAGAAVTTSQTGDFVVAVLFASSAKFSGTLSGSGWTDDFTTNGNGWAHLTGDTSPAGSYQPSWTTANPGGGFATSTVAFFPANP